MKNKFLQIMWAFSKTGNLIPFSLTSLSTSSLTNKFKDITLKYRKDNKLFSKKEHKKPIQSSSKFDISKLSKESPIQRKN